MGNNYFFLVLQVETLLSSFLKDFGISEEQFMKACSSSVENHQANEVHRVIKIKIKISI